VEVGADLDIGEMVGRPERATLRGYVRRIERDFFSNGNLQDRGNAQAGMSASVGITAVTGSGSG